MKKLLIALMVLFLVPLLVAQSHTITITITDTNNPAGTKHYCYHRLLGGTYGTADRKDVGTAASYAWVLTAPVALGTHQWVCTAYALDGATTIESPYSNEVPWVNAPTPPSISITNVAMTPIFKGGTLLANTNVPATMTITYGESLQYTLVRTVSSTLKTAHNYTLSGLKPHKTYIYYLTAKDSNGVTIQSTNYTFTTL